MTENNFVFSILNEIKPYLSDDSDLSPRQIVFDIAVQRALLIRNELNKTRSIDPNIIQDLGCVAIEVADPAECCDVTTGCYVMRTTLTIPKAIELHNNTGITRIGPVDKTARDYSKVNFNSSKWSGNGKYTTNEIYSYEANDRIYIISNNDKIKLQTYINIRGVFEEPSDVIPFTDCSSGSSCYSSDDEYPLKSWMFAYIQGQLFKKYAQRYNIPVDFLNDGSDNTTHKQVK